MNAPGSSLRVAHVTASFPPYSGGTGNVAWYQTLELARRGHDVHVFTADLGGSRVAPAGVHVHRLPPLLRIGNAPVLPSLVTALRGFDVVHLHYPFYSGGEFVWLASKLFQLPYVVTYQHDVQLGGKLALFPPVHHRILGNRVLRGASRVLFSTLDYGRTSFGAHLLSRPSTEELPNGVDLERFHPGQDGQAIRSELHLHPDTVLALFVGGLDRAHYFKGLPVLLQALRDPACARICLLVVGDGDLRASYERQAAQMGVANRVRFAGRVTDALLPSYYTAADFLVLPSTTRSEAFGLVLLEALACDRPVIASDLPGVRAVVRETGGGKIVPAGDGASLAQTMVSLANDPECRQRLGKKGGERVRARFSWSSIVPRLEAIYQQVARRHGQARLNTT